MVVSFWWKTRGRLCISWYLTFLGRGQTKKLNQRLRMIKSNQKAWDCDIQLIKFMALRPWWWYHFGEKLMGVCVFRDIWHFWVAGKQKNWTNGFAWSGYTKKRWIATYKWLNSWLWPRDGGIILVENSWAFVYFVIFDLFGSRATKKTEPTASHDQVEPKSMRLRHTTD